MSNEELVTQYHQAGDPAALEALYFQNMGLIRKTVLKYYQTPEDIEDAQQDAFFVLLSAADQYDPGRGASFSTFFGHMMEWTQLKRSSQLLPIRLPEYRLVNVHKLNKAEGSGMDDSQIKKFYSWTDRDLEQIRKDQNLLKTVSTEKSIAEDLTIADTIGEAEPGYEEAEDNSLYQAIWDQVNTLPESLAAVVQAHYRRGESLTSISEQRGVSVECCSQYCKKALKILGRNRYIQQIGIEKGYHSGLRAFRRSFTSSTEEAALYLYMKSGWMEYGSKHSSQLMDPCEEEKAGDTGLSEPLN